MTQDTVESVCEQLFSDEEVNVFAVLDGASVPGLLDKLYELSPDYCCLFQGELSPDMAEVAPYLVQLEPESEFASWVIRLGWGNHWGIFIATDADFRNMRRHLRSLLIVYDESGRPLRFRYYDPRVLRLYLPSCSAEELAAFFGPVKSFLVEDEDPNNIVCFTMEAGSFRQERLPMVRS